MASTHTKKSKRKFAFRFSLRASLVLFVFVALIFGWIQRSEMQRHHCSKFSASETDYGGWRFSETPSAWTIWLPESVREFRGGHYFKSIDEVWICNPHSSNLDWFNPDSSNEATVGEYYEATVRENWLKIRPLLPSCKKILFSSIKLQDFHFEDLSKASSLEVLKFRRVRNSDKKDLQFPKFPKLKTLDIGETWENSNQYLAACFKNLSASRALQRVEVAEGAHLVIDQIADNLSLEHCVLHSQLISDDAIEKLTHLPLKSLSVSSPLTDRAAESIAKIKTLQSVTLNQSKLTDDGVRLLASLPNLREIRLPGCLASPQIGDLLASAQQLEVVDIDKVFVEDQSLTKLLELPKLSEVKVMPECLSVRTLANLPDCGLYWGAHQDNTYYKEKGQKLIDEIRLSSNPALTAFSRCCRLLPQDLKKQLSQLNITGDEPELSNTKRLNLSRSNIDDDDLVILAKFSSLEYLDLSDTGVTDAGLAKLLQTHPWKGDAELWPQLYSLKLRNTRAGKVWIEFASQLPKLNYLDLAATKLTDGCFANLSPASFQKLTGICVAETQINSNELQHFSQFPLYSIDIQETSVGDEAIEHLLACKNLYSLKTGNSSITHRGEQRLVKALGVFVTGQDSNVICHITEPLEQNTNQYIAGEPDFHKSFVVDNPDLKFVDLAPLGTVKNIYKITVKQCDLSADEFARLIVDKNCILELCDDFCNPKWLNALASQNRIACERLHLRHKDLSLEHLRGIKDWKNLTELHLSGGTWDRAKLEELSRLPACHNLSTLQFVDTEVEIEAILGFKDHPTLKRVVSPKFWLSYCDCDWLLRDKVSVSSHARFNSDTFNLSEIFQALPCDARMREFKFNANNCTAEDWSNLTRLQFITTLTISCCDFDDTAIDCISQLPFLDCLILVDVEIDQAGLRRLNELPKLRRLVFSEMDFSGIDWRESLSHCKLSSILLDRCGVSHHLPQELLLCHPTGHRIHVTTDR